MFELHPQASIYPMMAEDDYQALKDDICKNGCLVPLEVTHDDLLLDGRHRQMACDELGVEPPIKRLEQDVDPLEYVISLNELRRHLTKSQRGLAAARRVAGNRVGRPEKTETAYSSCLLYTSPSPRD